MLKNFEFFSWSIYSFFFPSTFRQGHGLIRRRKRKHEDANLSNQSSVESIDPQAVIPIVGKRKFVALETKRYVAIAHLQQRLRRAERADGERGSTLVDVPTFESGSTDFERLCTAPKNITCVYLLLFFNYYECSRVIWSAFYLNGVNFREFCEFRPFSRN